MKTDSHPLKRHSILAIVLILLGFSVGACAATSAPSRFMTQEEWQEWIIETGVAKLFSMLDPPSCGAPEIEVDCWTQEDGIECCQAIARVQVDLPRMESEFGQAFQSEVSRFQRRYGRPPFFPLEMDWAIRISTKITLAIVEEYLKPQLELAVVSEQECHPVVEETIREHCPRLFGRHYASEFEMPRPAEPGLRIPTPMPMVPFNPPMIPP